ncbi:MAG: hypothetical protein JXQ73_07555 [Phycisphaerae bacterium]|nr:hypothetical protein [Phycisphaerae bacterium]
MSESWDTIKRVRPAMADDLERLVRKETGAVLDKLDPGAGVPEPDELNAAAGHSRASCLDALLDGAFADRASQAAGIGRPDLSVLAFDLRQSAAPLRIDPPEPWLQARLGVLMAAAALGALGGMVAAARICVLLEIPPDGIQTGRAVGALVGPAVGVALMHALTMHDRLRRAVQWFLGLLAVGIGASEVLGWINPAGRLWGLATGRMRSGSGWMKLKLFLLAILMILLLQLAKPTKRATRSQLRACIESAIRAWLAAQLDLMTLLLVLQTARSAQTPPPPTPPISSGPILESLRKLSASTTVEERSDIAQEVLQECGNAGLVFAQAHTEGLFEEALRDAYDVVGLIEPGDPYRELEPPVLVHRRVLVRGRITRKRDG